MAYQETNNLLNEQHLTPEEIAAYRDAQLEHRALRDSGALKRAADRVRSKPASR